MAIDPNKILTFSDLKSLVDNENYIEKNPFPISQKAVTKLEILDAIYIAGNPPLATHLDNRLIAYKYITPLGTAWVGDEFICVSDALDNPPTAPIIIAENITVTSIEVDWHAGISTDDNQVNAYEIQYCIDNGLFSWSSSSFVQDILVGPKEYVYQNLTPNTAYLFRVRSIDNIGQTSSWSNTLSASTINPTSNQIYAWVYKDGSVSDETALLVNAPSGDTLTFELEVTNGGTTGDYAEWHFYRSQPEDTANEVINGVDDAPIVFPTTKTIVGYTGSVKQTYGYVIGSSFRTLHAGYYGWAEARVRIINSSQGNPFPTGWFVFDIAASLSGH